jgi:hypothetical protein
LVMLDLAVEFDALVTHRNPARIVKRSNPHWSPDLKTIESKNCSLKNLSPSGSRLKNGTKRDHSLRQGMERGQYRAGRCSLAITLESRNVLNVRPATLLKNQKGPVPKILANRLVPRCLGLHIWRMIALDRWVENLRCPICRKTGTARLSQADGWSVHMESVPEGFKVVGSDNASNFYCASCNRPVEP